MLDSLRSISRESSYFPQGSRFPFVSKVTKIHHNILIQLKLWVLISRLWTPNDISNYLSRYFVSTLWEFTIYADILGGKRISDFFPPLSKLFELCSYYFYDEKLIHKILKHKSNVSKENKEKSLITTTSQLCNLEQPHLITKESRLSLLLYEVVWKSSELVKIKVQACICTEALLQFSRSVTLSNPTW